MTNPIDNRAASPDGSAANGFAIIPDDAAELAATTRALYVGNGGSVAVTMASGAELTFAGVQAGTWLPIRARKIKADGTTASHLVGLY